MAPRRGLGKGLDSMIPKKKKEVQSQKTDAPEDKSISTSERLHTDEPEKKELNPERMVKINLVEPNRKQPRKEFQEDALTDSRYHQPSDLHQAYRRYHRWSE